MDAETLATLSPWIQALATGLGYVGLAFAVYLTFRVLDFPDLTVNGSMSLGAVVYTALITVQHWNPWLTLVVCAGAGMLAGLVTGVLHTALRINGLLASILVTLGLYSINLRLLGMQANFSLLDQPSVFDILRPTAAGLPGLRDLALALGPLGASRDFRFAVMLAAINLVLVLAAYWWLNSEQGLAIRATGDNPQMIRALGVSTDRMKLLGLAVANGSAALSGCLLTQRLEGYDVGLGSDAIIIGLAGVILGEALLRPQHIHSALIGLVIGSLIYQVARTAVLLQNFVDIAAQDLQLATALLVIIALGVPFLRERLRVRSAAPAPAGRTP